MHPSRLWVCVFYKKNVEVANYSNRNLGGSNIREFAVVYVKDGLADIDKIFEENEKLIKQTWPNKEEIKTFLKKWTNFL